MAAHLPTLLAAVAAALVVVSASSATIGIRQRLKRGMWWWVGANAGLAGALACMAFASAQPAGHDAPATAAATLAALLALQWPMTTLVGMRRFFSRGDGGVPPWADAAVFALGALAAVGAWLVPFGGVAPEVVLAGAMLAVTAHAALAVLRLDDFVATPVLKSLLAALVCSGIAQAAWLALWLATDALAAIGGASLVALLAPAATALLLPQLSLAMNHERNVANLRASHRKLRHLVDVDTLSRLPNRRHFLELAARATKPAPELATVLMFDIDRLRNINDVLGHSVGDEALRQLGTVLRETLRRRDVAGRLGGDDFAVVLPRTRIVDADTVIARVKSAIDDRQVAPRIARVRVNVGATQMQAGDTLASALRRAEQQLEQSRDAARLGFSAEKTMPLAKQASQPEPSQAPSPRREAQTTGRMPLADPIPIGEVVD